MALVAGDGVELARARGTFFPCAAKKHHCASIPTPYGMKPSATEQQQVWKHTP